MLDLGIFIHRDSSSQAERDDLCLQVASTLQSSGCLIVRDPRVDHAENDSFIDMMEVYFGRTGEDKKAEERPELSYQVSNCLSHTDSFIFLIPFPWMCMTKRLEGFVNEG